MKIFFKMNKEKLLPVDLGHLEDKCLFIVDSFNKYHDCDRSEEYRNFHLKRAEQIADTLLHDFRHYFDEYEIGGMIPYGLDKKQYD